jgi:hypothetical protein
MHAPGRAVGGGMEGEGVGMQEACMHDAARTSGKHVHPWGLPGACTCMPFACPCIPPNPGGPVVPSYFFIQDNIKEFITQQ